MMNSRLNSQSILSYKSNLLIIRANSSNDTHRVFSVSQLQNLKDELSLANSSNDEFKTQLTEYSQAINEATIKDLLSQLQNLKDEKRIIQIGSQISIIRIFSTPKPMC